jgi:hypothetical protein
VTTTTGSPEPTVLFVCTEKRSKYFSIIFF